MSYIDAPSRGGIKIVSVPESFESSLCCKAKPVPPPEYPIITLEEHKAEKRSLTKLYVILNPFGGNGRGRRAWKKAESVFERENIECVVARTACSGHATELAREYNLNGFDGVVAIGGDGTISEVINGLMTRPDGFNLPLGMIPGGTGNSFLTSLKLLDPVEAAEAIVGGFHTRIDLGKITCRAAPDSPEEISLYMFNLVAWGLGVDANETAEKLRCCGKCRYDIGALIEVIRAKKRHLKLQLDGEIIEGECSVIMILNNQHTGTALRAAPRAMINDGKLDAILGMRRPRGEVIELFNELKRSGSHVYRDECDYRQVESIIIESDPPTQINVDGENLGGTPATIQTVPNALSFFVKRP